MTALVLQRLASGIVSVPWRALQKCGVCYDGSISISEKGVEEIDNSASCSSPLLSWSTRTLDMGCECGEHVASCVVGECHSTENATLFRFGRGDRHPSHVQQAPTTDRPREDENKTVETQDLGRDNRLPPQAHEEEDSVLSESAERYDPNYPEQSKEVQGVPGEFGVVMQSWEPGPNDVDR